MLLESALADFSKDDDMRGFDRVLGTESEAMPSMPKSPSKDRSNSDVGVAEIKHVYHLNLKLPPSKKLSAEARLRHMQGQSCRTPVGQIGSPSKVSDSRRSSSSFEKSRSPPALDLNLDCSSGSETPKQHRSLTFGREEDHLHASSTVTDEEGAAMPFARVTQPRNLQSSNPTSRAGIYENNSFYRRSVSFGADESHSRENIGGTGLQAAATVPFKWETQPGKPKAPQDSRTVQQVQQQSRLPPGRVISMLTRETDDSPRHQSFGSFTRAIVPAALAQKKESKKQQQQQGMMLAMPYSNGGLSISSSNSCSGDATQMENLQCIRNSSPRGKDPSRNDAESCSGMNSELKFYEQSPVSTLERLSNPPPINSSESSGSSVLNPRIGSAPVFRDSSLAGGAALARRRLPSFSSSSAHSSPRASASSSTRYMSQCLVALQAALANDPEKSKRFEDSFVELDTFEDGDDEEGQNFVKSPINHNFVRSDMGSPGWERGEYSELEPEYNTMDFYSDDEDGGFQSNVRSFSASSLARSYSGSSTNSIMSRPIRRSVTLPTVSVDDYSMKDKRFLSDHPSSWVERGDDSVSSSLTNSKCSTLNRHQDVSWDDQQADMNSERAEEVVRGAVDGLRFTYSPVSSAFVFAPRSNDEDDNESDTKRHSHYSHFNTTDSETSKRFSVSIDYATSVCSEDSHCFARASDVTELGVSRAESWSKVARGIAFQQQQQQHAQPQGYQDAVRSSFRRRAAGYAPLCGDGSSVHSPMFNSSGFGHPIDSQLVRKRPSKKSGMATCLPFRSILRNFRTIGSPGRSRLGLSGNGDRPVNWTSPAVTRLSY